MTDCIHLCCLNPWSECCCLRMFGLHPVSLFNCGNVASRRVLRLRYQRLWWRFYVPIRQKRRLPWCWRGFACQDHRRADNKQCGREDSRRGQSGGLIAGELIAQEFNVSLFVICSGRLLWFSNTALLNMMFHVFRILHETTISCTTTARFGRRELPGKLVGIAEVSSTFRMAAYSYKYFTMRVTASLQITFPSNIPGINFDRPKQ